MSSARQWAIIAIVIGGGIVLFLLRRPEISPGSPLIESVEKSGSEYKLIAKHGVPLSKLIELKVFAEYSPAVHSEYKQRLDEAAPGKYVEGSGRHYFIEYVVPNGRVQLHSDFVQTEYGDDAPEWYELIPRRLAVDDFFSPSVSINFDMSKSEFTVYLPLPERGEYMTVYVKDRSIERIYWAPHRQ